MGQVILLSLTASLNPTLVGATTVMLLLPSPSKLMLGYLLGAYVTSITLGLVIVFSLSNSSTTSTTQNTLSPAVDIALGRSRCAAHGLSGTGVRNGFGSAGGHAKQAKPDKRAAQVAAGAEQGVRANHVRGRDAAHASRRLIPGRARSISTS